MKISRFSLFTNAGVFLFSSLVLAQVSGTFSPEEFEKTPWRRRGPVDSAYMAQAVACVKSVCGEADKNFSAIDTRDLRLAVPAQNYLKMWDTRFEQTLRNIVSIRKEAANLAEKKMRDWMASPFAMDLTQPDMALHNYGLISSTVDKLAAYVSFDQDRKPRVNSTLHMKMMDGLSPEEKLAVQLMLERYIQPNVGLILFAKMNPPNALQAGRAKIKFPRIPLEQAKIADGRQVLSHIAAIAKVMGRSYTGLLFNEASEKVLNKVISGKELSSFEQVIFIEAANKADLYFVITSDPQVNAALVNLPSRLPMTAAQFNTRNMGFNHLQKWERMDPPAEINEISQKCRSNLHESLEMSTSNLRLARGQQMFNEVRDSAKRVAMQMADERMVDEVDIKISTLELEQPETIDQRIVAVESALTKDQDSALKMKSLLEDRDPRAQRAFQVMLLTSTISASFANPLAVRNVCVDLPKEVLSDYARASTNSISVSWFSFNYPKIGVGVIAHEIGHIVSSILRVQSSANSTYNPVFVRSRSCVEARNPYPYLKRKAFVASSSPYVEEDFADYFGSLVLNDLKARGSVWTSESNVACALRLDMGSQYEVDFQPGLGDPHSTAFLRLLMIANDRKSVTKECQPFVDALSVRSPLQCE